MTLVNGHFVGGTKEKAGRQSLRRNPVDDSKNSVHHSVKLCQNEKYSAVYKCGISTHFVNSSIIEFMESG